MKRGSLLVALGMICSIACGGAQPAPTPPSTVMIADAGAASAPVVVSADEGHAKANEAEALVPIFPSDPSWGSRNALVTIVEFSDFQCPFCARAETTLEQLKTEYGPEKLRVVWKNEPLPFHQNAKPAAEAAVAVFTLGGNDAFWRFHALAFKNQKDLSDESYERWAESIGVDVAQLRRGLRAHTSQPKVDEDEALAKRLGVNGTPAFFINGTPLSGAQPLDRFKKIIDEEMTKASALVTAGTAPSRVYTESVAVNAKNAPAKDDDDDDRGPPPDTRIYRIPVGKAPILGPKDAPITIVEYSDFECPFCGRVEGTLKQVRARYGDKVRIVWKNNPLPFHPRATPAAELALEARVQKGDAAFWSVHDKLFERRDHLADADLETIATSIGLDVKRWKAAVLARKHSAAIDADKDEADAFQAMGTPHFFINGRRLVGAQPFEAFQPILDDALARANAVAAKGIAPAAVYDELMKDAAGPAEPEKKTVALAPNAPARGAAGARIVVQEFSDFQCPFCKRVQPALDELLKAYPGRVKIVWRNLPLPFHQNAMPAAEAASEAYKQKGAAGFWKMHDLLFAAQGTEDGLKREALEGYAIEVGLDLTKFKAALDGHVHKASIEADAKAANDAGITGTPGFVINGYYVSGAQPYSKFRRTVERALADGAGRK